MKELDKLSQRFVKNKKSKKFTLDRNQTSKILEEYKELQEKLVQYKLKIEEAEEYIENMKVTTTEPKDMDGGSFD